MHKNECLVVWCDAGGWTLDKKGEYQFVQFCSKRTRTKDGWCGNRSIQVFEIDRYRDGWFECHWVWQVSRLYSSVACVRACNVLTRRSCVRSYLDFMCNAVPHAMHRPYHTIAYLAQRMHTIIIIIAYSIVVMAHTALCSSPVQLRVPASRAPKENYYYWHVVVVVVVGIGRTVEMHYHVLMFSQFR